MARSTYQSVSAWFSSVFGGRSTPEQKAAKTELENAIAYAVPAVGDLEMVKEFDPKIISSYPLDGYVKLFVCQDKKFPSLEELVQLAKSEIEFEEADMFTNWPYGNRPDEAEILDVYNHVQLSVLTGAAVPTTIHAAATKSATRQMAARKRAAISTAIQWVAGNARELRRERAAIKAAQPIVESERLTRRRKAAMRGKVVVNDEVAEAAAMLKDVLGTFSNPAVKSALNGLLNGEFEVAHIEQ